VSIFSFAEQFLLEASGNQRVLCSPFACFGYLQYSSETSVNFYQTILRHVLEAVYLRFEPLTHIGLEVTFSLSAERVESTNALYTSGT
jgi:hypothetical protein